MTNKVRRYVMSCLLGVLFAAFASAHTAQAPASLSDYELRIGGEVEHDLKLGPADLSRLPRRSVVAKDHDGTESTFEGAALIDVLQLAGVKFGEGLRGKSLALYLVVEAADGYRAVFALPELDPAFTDHVVLLVDRRDGRKLSDAEGPLRIVVQGEKRQARWVRQVRSLIIKRA